MIEQVALMGFFLEDPLPLCDTDLFGTVSMIASRHAVLQRSCRMRKQPFVFHALSANVESHLRLVNR